MFSVKNLIFLAASVSAVAITRSTNLITSDLYTLDADILRLTSDVAKGAPNAAAISASVDRLHNDVNVAISDMETGAKMTEDAAKSLASYFEATFQADFFAALAEFEAEKASFEKALQTEAIKEDVKTLRKDFGNFLIALSYTLPESADKIDAIAHNLDDAFAKVVTDYSS